MGANFFKLSKMTTQIKAGGKERPFRISFKGLRRFTKATKLSLAKLEEALSNFDFLLILIQIGFEEGYKKEEKKIDFTKNDVENWLDDDMSLITKCSEAISESLGGNEDDKKEVTKKNLPKKEKI